MRVAKDGMVVPEMQDISRMLKKNNKPAIALALQSHDIIESLCQRIRSLMIDSRRPYVTPDLV